MLDQLINHVRTHLQNQKSFVVFVKPQEVHLEGWFSSEQADEANAIGPQNPAQGPQFIMQDFDVSVPAKILNKNDCAVIHATLEEEPNVLQDYNFSASNETGATYTSLIVKAIQSMRNGLFDKVVLSRAHQIDLNNEIEALEIHRLIVAINGPRGQAEAGRIHTNPQRAEFAGGSNNGIGVFGFGDVALNEYTTNLIGDLLTTLFVKVRHDHLGPCFRQLACGRFADTRGASGYD